MIYSYTSFNCYENCPKQFYYRYIAKALPFVETDAMRWGNRVHSALARRLKLKEPLPPPLMQFETLCADLEAEAGPTLIEQTLYISRDGKATAKNNAFLSARADFVTFNDGYSHAVILDWKTGRPREDDAELCLQAATLRAHYPTLKTADACYFWVKEGRPGPLHDVIGHLDAVWARLCEIVDLIEIQTRGGEKAFPAKPGKHFPCPYCAATFCPFREEPQK